MELCHMIKEAGVIGAGGAGFPTHAKLASSVDYILLNGAECEPLLRVDQQLMERFPREVIQGFAAAGRVVHATKALIGIKKKHKEVISIMRQTIQALAEEAFVEVRELPDIYPAGDEQVLVYELTGRVVPEAGIPGHVGCVVINTETALNIYHAAQGVPVTETYVTVAGDVPKPFTAKVPVGTPLVDVLKASGLDDLDGYAVIDGGPMMGAVLPDLNGYVSKKAKGYVVLKKSHSLIRRKTTTPEQAKRINKSGCEQCRMCTDLCPRYLLGHDIQPHKMMRVLNYAIDDLEGQKTAQLCVQCNLCELFSCPIGLYPKAANVYFKDKLTAQNIRYKPTKQQFNAQGERQSRLLPSKRLVARLGLRAFDNPAPMIEISIEPEMVFIHTKPHIGAPAVPSVIVGTRVAVGQMLGNVPDGSLGAAIHASISGTVTEIRNDGIMIRRDGYGDSNRNG